MKIDSQERWLSLIESLSLILHGVSSFLFHVMRKEVDADNLLQLDGCLTRLRETLESFESSAEYKKMIEKRKRLESGSLPAWYKDAGEKDNEECETIQAHISGTLTIQKPKS